MRIVGPAETWRDILKVPAGDTMVVNGAIQGPLADYWVSLHNEVFETYPSHVHKISGDSSPGGDEWWNMKDRFMFSGVFAAMVGVLMGYDEIYIVGMPADYDVPYGRYMKGIYKPDGSRQKEGWQEYIEYFDNIRVLGGNLPKWFPHLKFDPVST